MIVRNAEFEDMKQLGHIMAVSFRAAFSAFVTTQTLDACAREENCAALLENICREGKMHFLLGENSGMLAWQTVQDSAEIVAIHSLPESWGTGLGYVMLEEALRQIGERTVFLWAFKENRRARRFYEKHGFSWDGSERVSEFDGALEVRYVRKPGMNRENRMFDEMMKAAKLRLADRNPIAIANNANVEFSGGAFRFQSLGISVTVSYPACEITPNLDPWHALVILHYLDLADGTPLTGETIPFAAQKDGLVRGGGFDRRAEEVISKLDFDALKARCSAMGGTELSTNADYSVRLPFLPMYPVTLNYWLADEDFPASGRLLTDSSAEHYLTIEDAVTVGEVLLGKLA